MVAAQIKHLRLGKTLSRTARAETSGICTSAILRQAKPDGIVAKLTKTPPDQPEHHHIAMILVAATLVAAAAALAPPAKVDVAIAGGGLGGLAACAALRARGVDAHVFEAAGELLRGSTGTGIMISANGMAALGAVDRRLPAAMRARGVRITAQHITKYAADGEVELRRTSDATTFRDAFGHDQYNIAWSAAHAALAAVVPRENVHCGRAVAGATAADGGVDVAFADGSAVRCGLLVGADGIGSRVRELVAPGADAPRYSGQLLWNAIIDSEALPLHGPGEVSFATTGLDGRAILAFDAGGGKTSWYLTLPLDAAPRSAEAIAAGSFGGFGGDLDDLRASFAGFPDALACLAATPPGDVSARRLGDRPPLRSWTALGGRVVLLGDAAHPMVPSQGQGTMVTWEDAAELAECLAASSDMAAGVPAAVDAFVARRAKRCAMVQRFSRQTYMGRTSPTFFPRKMLRALRSVRKINQIYGYKVSP